MNEEMITKLKEAKSAEDVLAIAKEYGKEMTLEQARALCEKLKASANGELDDEAVEAVAGGEMSFDEKATFNLNNCQRCINRGSQCPYGGPEGASQAGLSGNSKCPSFVHW